MANENKLLTIDTKVGNVISENSLDRVILRGRRFGENSEFMDNLNIIINQSNGGPLKIISTPYGGYNLQLFLGDFNGDRRDDIMIRGDSGGSGGYAIAAIYTYNYNYHQFIEIFNPDMFSNKYKFEAKYLDDYKVQVNSLTLNRKYIIDISMKPRIYLDLVYDNNGKVKENIIPTVSAINAAYPIQSIYKESYSLFIRQRIIGVNNADTLGVMESFVYLNDNNINVIDMGAFTFGEKLQNDKLHDNDKFH
ncbi:hypothetical protein [Clostridium sp. UBA1056]|uniref:hypothetical protein n=1 Tax=unclassified Clostridium TaxID=2614128 RepID=UPI00321694F5